MLPLENRIESLIHLGRELEHRISSFRSGSATELSTLIASAARENPWFDERNIIAAMEAWSIALQSRHVQAWVDPYRSLLEESDIVTIGVVNAGNIPFVGMHDLISVLLCGHNYIGKNATGDGILLPFIAEILCDIEPAFRKQLRFTDRLEKMNAVIATGSNNSARYFEYYFKKYPHIIRKNRNGVAILNGEETGADLKNLGLDVFSFFGLGCRNVSKIYVPENYNFNALFEAIYEFSYVMQHVKYMNNFDFNNSVLLLKQIPFLQNGFLIIRNDTRISSPIAVLHYENYTDLATLENELLESKSELQCIAASDGLIKKPVLKSLRVPFGKTQSPDLWDYADGIDTLKFLCELKS